MITFDRVQIFPNAAAKRIKDAAVKTRGSLSSVGRQAARYVPIVAGAVNMGSSGCEGGAGEIGSHIGRYILVYLAVSALGISAIGKGVRDKLINITNRSWQQGSLGRFGVLGTVGTASYATLSSTAYAFVYDAPAQGAVYGALFGMGVAALYGLDWGIWWGSGKVNAQKVHNFYDDYPVISKIYTSLGAATLILSIFGAKAFAFCALYAAQAGAVTLLGYGAVRGVQRLRGGGETPAQTQLSTAAESIIAELRTERRTNELVRLLNRITNDEIEFNGDQMSELLDNIIPNLAANSSAREVKDAANNAGIYLESLLEEGD